MDACSGVSIDSHDVNKAKSESSDGDDKLDMKDFKEVLLNCEEEIKEAESDEEYSDAKDVCSDEELDIDEESITDSHKDLSDDQLKILKDEAITLKNKGNDCFKNAEYKEAVNFYTQALNTCPLKYQNDRSILYANRAAARISLDKKEEAVLDCNKVQTEEDIRLNKRDEASFHLIRYDAKGSFEKGHIDDILISLYKKHSGIFAVLNYETKKYLERRCIPAINIQHMCPDMEFQLHETKHLIPKEHLSFHTRVASHCCFTIAKTTGQLLKKWKDLL